MIYAIATLAFFTGVLVGVLASLYWMLKNTGSSTRGEA